MRQKPDERQLMLKGKMYFHVFTIMAAFLTLAAILAMHDYYIAEGPWSYILILVIPNSIGVFELCLRDAMVFPYRRFKHAFVVFCFVAGVLFLVLSIVDFTVFKNKFFADRGMSASGAELIFGIFYLGMSLAFLLKKIIDKKKLKKEEEDVLIES